MSEEKKNGMEQLTSHQACLPHAVIEAQAKAWGCNFAQMAEIASIIPMRGGSMTGDDAADLELAAGAYSKACGVHECSGWLPFNVMPGWQDDVFCILEDEDAWLAAINANESIDMLADRLRSQNEVEK
jgi:hypothetical protein